MGLSALAVLALRRTEPPCAYVVGQVDGTSVATPAVPLTGMPEEPPWFPSSGPTGWTCSLLGVSTPALPVHLPTSRLGAPGTLQRLHALTFEFPGTRLRQTGHAIHLSGERLLLIPQPYRPKQDLAGLPVSLSFQLKGVTKKALLLLPPTPLPVTAPK